MTRSLSENKMALFNIASTVLVAGINFFTIPIFTRMLDTGGYGIINIYTAWVQIFAIFIGLKADGSIGSAAANLPEEEQDSYQFSIAGLSLVSFGIVLSLVLLFLDPLSVLLGINSTLVVCMVLQSFGSFVISLFGMRFIFKKQAHFNFALSVGLCVATTALSIVLIFFVYTNGAGYFGRAFGLAVPNVLIALGLLLFFTFKRGKQFKFSYWKFCLTLTLPLIFHGLSQLILAQTGKIAIQQVYGDSLAGVFSIAVVIVSLLNAIYGALNNAFVPFMYDDFAGKTTEEIKQRHFRNYFTSFTFGTCAFVLIAPEILKIMSTEAYWTAIQVLPPLVMGQYFIFLYSFPVNFQFYKMSTRSIAIGTVGAAILNIILMIFLVPVFGMIGAAVSTMVAYFFLFVFHFCIARFALDDRNYPARYYFYGLTLTAAVCFGCYPLMDIPLVRWIVALAALACVAVRIYKTRSIF